MPVELKVVVKDSDRKLERKFLEYEDFELTREHPLVKARILSTMEEFHGDKEDVDVHVNAKLVAK